MTEYCRESEILTIYHIGTHSCPLKPNTKKYRHQVREAVLRNSGLVQKLFNKLTWVRQLQQVTSRRHREELCSFPRPT